MKKGTVSPSFTEQILNALLTAVNLAKFERDLDGTGLSLRAGGRGFSPDTKRVAPGYFGSKTEEK